MDDIDLVLVILQNLRERLSEADVIFDDQNLHGSPFGGGVVRGHAGCRRENADRMSFAHPMRKRLIPLYRAILNKAEIGAQQLFREF